MYGNLNIGTNYLSNVKDPANAPDDANKRYVEAKVGNTLALVGVPLLVRLRCMGLQRVEYTPAARPT